MIQVEEKLDYGLVLDLLRLDAPDIVPIEEPTPEQLERLEEVISAAEDIFSPWPEDFNG